MLSSAALQLIAIVTMIVDHTAIAFFGGNLFMRTIGRVAFPVFAFMIAEGFRHTRSVRNYFLRVLLMSVAATIPAALFLRSVNYMQSLVVTYGFCLALIAMWAWKRGAWWRLLIVPIVGFSIFAPIDYSASSVLLPFFFYLALEKFADKRKKAPLLVSEACIIVADIVLLSLTYKNLFSLGMVLAFLPIALYSGKKGMRLPAIVSYGLYPLHFLLLYLSRLWLF